MRYIVDFHNNAPDSDISMYLSDNGCTVLKEWDNFDKVYLVEAAAEPPVTSIVAFVKDDSHTVIKPLTLLDGINNYYNTFNPNYPVQTISTTDQKDWWKNYTLQNPVFDQPTAQFSMKGNHISVYIMDSGIDATHPEFEGVSITNIYSVTPGDFSDNSGHGTALASVISGKTCGVSTAKLKIVKIFDPNHQTLQSEFLDALDAILADVPPNSFAILNCSWAIPRNEWVEYKLKECMDDGVWIIASAGNDGTPIENVTPAAMPESFVIGAYDQDLKPCYFSDYTGESTISNTPGQVNTGKLDGWAPGYFIWSANRQGGYGYNSGTSMAAAIASGVAAHNLNDQVDSNGQRLPYSQGFILVGPSAQPMWIVSRPDLLDLSDPKYSNSVNVIATLIDTGDTAIKRPADELFGSIRVGAEGSVTRVFNPHDTKSVDIIDPLPENFTILPNGLLWGKPVANQGPTNDEAYKEYISRVKRVYYDDSEEVVTIHIYVLSSNFKPEDLPEDHVINITLQTQCVFIPFQDQCAITSSSTCLDLCSIFCCDVKGLQCICYDTFGES